MSDELCEFNCLGRTDAKTFDSVVRAETLFQVSLATLVTNHVGWYYDKSEDGDEEVIRDLELTGAGVYILWCAAGHCLVHEKTIFEAVYVGKTGRDFSERLLVHFRTKVLGRGLPVEVSIWPALNRQAKYVEQCLLDLFSFRGNTSENVGTRLLLLPLGPAEWN